LGGDHAELAPCLTGEDLDLQPGAEAILRRPDRRHRWQRIALDHAWSPDELCPARYASMPISCNRASFRSTCSASVRRWAASRTASSASSTARICAASSPALYAPSIATVATGMPRG